MAASSALAPAQVIVDPLEGVARAVQNRRFGWPLAAVMIASALATLALYIRLDATSQVVGKLTMSGELQRATEAELIEQIQTAERLALVGGLARAVFVLPFLCLAIATVLKVCAWLFDRKATFAACFTAAAVAMLPAALYQVVMALALLNQIAVTLEQAQRLVPSSLASMMNNAPPKLLGAASAVDFFNLWGAGLLGLGFSAASGMPRGRGALLGIILYAMYAGIFLIAMPAMGGGGR
jgi:hypothetical protein